MWVQVQTDGRTDGLFVPRGHQNHPVSQAGTRVGTFFLRPVILFLTIFACHHYSHHLSWSRFRGGSLGKAAMYTGRGKKRKP